MIGYLLFDFYTSYFCMSIYFFFLFTCFPYEVVKATISLQLSTR